MLWGMSAQRRATYHLMRGTGATTGVKMDGRWTPKPCKWMQPICHAHTRGQLCCTLQAQSATSAVLWVKGTAGVQQKQQAPGAQQGACIAGPACHNTRLHYPLSLCLPTRQPRAHAKGTRRAVQYRTRRCHIPAADTTVGRVSPCR